MRQEWLPRPLAELGEIVTGTTPPSSEPDLFGQVHPFLTPSDMTYDARHVATERFLSEEGGSRFESRILPAGSVSFVCIGATIGKVAMTQVATLTNQQINSIVVDPENHHPDFVYYLLRQYVPEIRQHAGGAATPILNKTAFSRIELPIPPLPVQRKIAGVLAEYDELIENNLRRIQILEEMAQAVYREWFVNFRFSGHEDVALVDSPLGPIPEGWQVSTLGNESSVVMGQSPKSEFYNDDGIGLPFHQGVTYFGTLFPEHVKYCTVESRIAEAGDTLVSVRAPVGRINVADTRMVIGRGLAAVRNLNDECPGFHYRQMRHVFREEDAMGGGTIYKAITKGDLLGVHWLVPPSDIRAAFEALERPLFALTANLTRQIRTLRAARDLLLTKLVSGEIEISELEIDTEWLAS